MLYPLFSLVKKTIQKQEERDSFEIVGAWQDFTIYDEMGDIVITFNDIRKVSLLFIEYTVHSY